MADLLEDQEPVMKGPPFNPVVDLTTLSHDAFITRAKEVMTPWNPEGHPPTGVSSPTMQTLIDGLEVTRESYASIANPMKNKSPPSESSYRKRKASYCILAKSKSKDGQKDNKSN